MNIKKISSFFLTEAQHTLTQGNTFNTNVLITLLAIPIILGITAYAVHSLIGRVKKQGSSLSVFSQTKILADRGRTYAQCTLAIMYKNGQGVEQNLKEAAKYFHLAAKQGDIQAQSHLADMYDQGEGVKQDFVQAAHYHQLVCADRVQSQARLGEMHYKGEGVKQNFENAFLYWKQAAEQEDAESQFRLGRMYAKGEGVKKSLRDSIHWYLRAAMKGHEAAHSSLAKMLQKGKGTEIIFKKTSPSDDLKFIEEELAKVRQSYKSSNQVKCG